MANRKQDTEQAEQSDGAGQGQEGGGRGAQVGAEDGRDGPQGPASAADAEVAAGAERGQGHAMDLCGHRQDICGHRQDICGHGFAEAPTTSEAREPPPTLLARHGARPPLSPKIRAQVAALEAKIAQVRARLAESVEQAGFAPPRLDAALRSLEACLATTLRHARWLPGLGMAPREKRPRCGARTRRGTPCQAPSAWDEERDCPTTRNHRCRFHGGNWNTQANLAAHERRRASPAAKKRANQDPAE